MSKHRAILIAGPTASGKSAAVLELADALNGIVINADSKQVYRELRVLSARPSEQTKPAYPICCTGSCLPRRPIPPAAGWRTFAVRCWRPRVRESCRSLPVAPDFTSRHCSRVFPRYLTFRKPYVHAGGKHRPKNRPRTCTPCCESRIRRWRRSCGQATPNGSCARLRSSMRPAGRWRNGNGRPGKPLLKEDEAARIFLTRPRDALHARITCTLRLHA